VSLPPVNDSIVDAVVTNAIADAKSSVFDVSTFLGELRETNRMLADNAGGIFEFARRAARDVRKRRIKPRDLPIGRRFDAFNSRFLELQFGWKPLLGAAEDAVNALSNKMEKGMIVDGSNKVTTPFDVMESAEVPNFSSQGLLLETHTLKGSRIYRGKAFAEIIDPTRHRWGMDPILTAYELVRFSFVVDYFIHVGNWLQAISPFSGARLLGSCGSIRESYEMKQEVAINFAANADSTGYYTGRSTTIQVDRYHRFPHSGGILPSWNPRITTIRMANLAALAYANRKAVYRILFD
jgi:hypothetical protein